MTLVRQTGSAKHILWNFCKLPSGSFFDVRKRNFTGILIADVDSLLSRRKWGGGGWGSEKKLRGGEFPFPSPQSPQSLTFSLPLHSRPLSSTPLPSPISPQVFIRIINIVVFFSDHTFLDTSVHCNSLYYCNDFRRIQGPSGQQPRS